MKCKRPKRMKLLRTRTCPRVALEPGKSFYRVAACDERRALSEVEHHE